MRTGLPESDSKNRIDMLLLEFSASACFLKLLLDVFRLFLRRTFLNRRRRSVHKAFGLFQAKPGDRANNLNDVDLLLTC